MNSEIIGKGIETANNVVAALKTSPILLAFLILQVIVLAGIGWAIITREGYLHEERKGWYEYQKQITELLSRCVVPGRSQ